MKKDWEIKKLGDVCEFRRGLTYSKNDEVENSSNAVLRSNNIDLITNQLDLSEIKYISDKIKIDEIKKVKRNSLLICIANGSKTHLGKVALIDDDYDFAFGGFMGLLIPNENIYPSFFYYALISDKYKKFIKSLSDGANINNLKFQDLSNFEIPVPPLEEQKRIVKILDEKFAQLETIKANAQTNLQNAKDLFQTQLTKAFSNTTWEKKRLGDICRITSGGTPSRTNKSYWENGNIPWVKTTELQNNELNSTEEFITQKGLDESSAKIVPKDTILLAMYGQGKTRGMTAYLNIEATTNQACACILPSEDKNIYPKYIWKFLIGNYENIRNLAIGCNQPNLNSAMVKSIEIPLPPLPEQKRIVKELDTLSEKVKALQNIYEQMLLDCEELKQSFLCKAFAGEL